MVTKNITTIKLKHIRLIKDTFGNNEGELIEIEEETEGEIYYTDGLDRWVYLNKSEDGTTFRWFKP